MKAAIHTLLALWADASNGHSVLYNIHAAFVICSEKRVEELCMVLHKFGLVLLLQIEPHLPVGALIINLVISCSPCACARKDF